MAGTHGCRRSGRWVGALLGASLLFAGCSDAECLSGPLCGDDTVVTGTISGSVRAGTAGIANVAVTISDGTTASTASNGTYSFTDVPVGTYTVTIGNLPPQVSCASSRKTVTLSNSERHATADFLCERLDIGTPVGR